MTDRERTLAHLRLVGDGDEIEAVERVEAAFGVVIDTSGAGSWVTVGDLLDALVACLPDAVAGQPDAWRRFCLALSEVEDDDPALIGRETLLIDPRGIVEKIGTGFGRWRRSRGPSRE